MIDVCVRLLTGFPYCFILLYHFTFFRICSIEGPVNKLGDGREYEGNIGRGGGGLALHEGF